MSKNEMISSKGGSLRKNMRLKFIYIFNFSYKNVWKFLFSDLNDTFEEESVGKAEFGS